MIYYIVAIAGAYQLAHWLFALVDVIGRKGSHA